MSTKLIMLSLLSLSIYPSIYSMDKQKLTEEQIKQVATYQEKKSNNETLARFAGLATALCTYMFPVASFFEKYKKITPEWESWNSKNLPRDVEVFFLPLVMVHKISEPHKYQYNPKSIQNTIYALKVLKGIVSLYAGYKAYKFVKNKLEPANAK